MVPTRYGVVAALRAVQVSEARGPDPDLSTVRAATLPKVPSKWPLSTLNPADKAATTAASASSCTDLPMFGTFCTDTVTHSPAAAARVPSFSPDPYFIARHTDTTSPELQLDPPETKAPWKPDDTYPRIEAPYDCSEPQGLCGDTLSQTFRHSGWKRDRLTVYAALTRTGQSMSRLNSFSGCGENAYVLKSNEHPPRYRVAGSSCHDRFCQVCASERSQAIALNVLAAIDKQRVRFVTLTMRQQDRPLAVSIDCLYKSFRKLQRLKHWRQRVKAGVGFLELKYKEETGLWNVHLHLLVTGRFIPKRELSQWWHTVTGDSFIVNIKLPADGPAVTRYVTKYATKPLNSSYLHLPHALDEAIAAVKGRRMCTTFGGWRGVLLVDHPDEEAWENVGPLDLWIARAAAGDDDAVNVLRQVNPDRAAAAIQVQASARPPPGDLPPLPEPRPLLFNIW